MAEAAAAASASGAQLDTDLPKAVIKRIVKTKLEALGEGNIQLHKDATLALAESAKVLINFLTVTSNDICKEKKRQTISADDVLQALEDLDFTDLVAPLQVALDAYRQATKEKTKKRAEANKKRKEREGPEATAGGEGGDAAAGQDQQRGAAGGGGEAGEEEEEEQQQQQEEDEAMDE
ncbi:DNA polymerase epsilon subunit 3 [Raphidocelis subcapitata]|uniref:DNA polymerase epsilon subunit 3 n=1 Tax=Raphidocelis subcapitata TaxID=307507 RepID=A0A2V0NNL8_9CHLO|nr:DNA polymerase epsilon subunit 3 [Raphidocelis subcapitata]|eukprot:GBF88092.1 DNA polymerase epsilon subunit 3 [Raphidocelis subcapitata]